MPGPFHSVLYIHNAILKECNDFEEAAQNLKRDDNSQIGAILERFRFFREVLKEHEGGEEEFFFPRLEEVFRHISGTYIFDHRHHDGEYDEIEECLTALGQARGNSERTGLAQKLHLQAIIFSVTMDMHITKENELLLPVCDEHISFEEQGRLLGEAMSQIPQEIMMKVLPWMFKAQTVNDREGFLREGKEMFPPEQYSGMTQLISSSVSPQEWKEMVRRIPELAAPLAGLR